MTGLRVFAIGVYFIWLGTLVLALLTEKKNRKEVAKLVGVAGFVFSTILIAAVALLTY